ncbi:MAG: hypothetical protein JW982_04460 [Spirochaetes bacterium]|nr:hypothetical protein [Spirochaetota bacterium]
MAKFNCPYCDGFIQTSGLIPNLSESLLISDKEFHDEPDKIDYESLYKKMIHLFRCNSCNSIAIFWEGMNSLPTWYNENS